MGVEPTTPAHRRAVSVVGQISGFRDRRRDAGRLQEVPVTVSSRLLSWVRTPALRNAFASRSTRLSLTRSRTRSVRAVWSIESKHASMSASRPQP